MRVVFQFNYTFHRPDEVTTDIRLRLPAMCVRRQTAKAVLHRLQSLEPTCVQCLRRGNAQWKQLTPGEEKCCPASYAAASLATPLYQGTTVNKVDITAIALVLSLAFSTGALAQSMSRHDYKAGKHEIEAQYKSAKASCTSLSGNPNDICEAEARGKNKVAMAELEASYKPSRKTLYRVSVAKAEADYGVAKEQCDRKAGNAKAVCMKEAKAMKIAAKADARVQMKTSVAKATTRQESADARKGAATEKLDAEYAVAKEKCDEMAGRAKDVCLKDAKARFGKA